MFEPFNLKSFSAFAAYEFQNVPGFLCNILAEAAVLNHLGVPYSRVFKTFNRFYNAPVHSIADAAARARDATLLHDAGFVTADHVLVAYLHRMDRMAMRAFGTELDNQSFTLKPNESADDSLALDLHWELFQRGPLHKYYDLNIGEVTDRAMEKSNMELLPRDQKIRLCVLSCWNFPDDKDRELNFLFGEEGEIFGDPVERAAIKDAALAQYKAELKAASANK